MKEGIHPKVYPVVYVDGDHEWTGISTSKTNATRTIDGIEHFVVNVEICRPCGEIHAPLRKSACQSRQEVKITSRVHGRNLSIGFLRAL